MSSGPAGVPGLFVSFRCLLLARSSGSLSRGQLPTTRGTRYDAARIASAYQIGNYVCICNFDTIRLSIAVIEAKSFIELRMESLCRLPGRPGKLQKCSILAIAQRNCMDCPLGKSDMTALWIQGHRLRRCYRATRNRPDRGWQAVEAADHIDKRALRLNPVTIGDGSHHRRCGHLRNPCSRRKVSIRAMVSS